MTARVLKQDPNTQMLKVSMVLNVHRNHQMLLGTGHKIMHEKNATFIGQKKYVHIFGVGPLLKATKQQLKKAIT